MKNFIDPETAGGCGVVPFLSVIDFFRQHIASPALRSDTDPFATLRGNSLRIDVLRMRLVACECRYKKTRTRRVLISVIPFHLVRTLPCLID